MHETGRSDDKSNNMVKWWAPRYTWRRLLKENNNNSNQNEAQIMFEHFWKCTSEMWNVHCPLTFLNMRSHCIIENK